MSGIYAITHRESGKSYVGSTNDFDFRWYQHRRELRLGIHHSTTLQRAWDKYGPEAFVFEVLERCPEGDLLTREQHWLNALKPFAATHDGYNENPIAGKPPVQYNHGRSPWPKGKKRPPRTEAHKAALSASLKGKPKKRTPEHQAALWAARRANGTTGHTEATRAKISAAKAGRVETPAHQAARAEGIRRYWAQRAVAHALLGAG